MPIIFFISCILLLILYVFQPTNKALEEQSGSVTVASCACTGRNSSYEIKPARICANEKEDALLGLVSLVTSN